MAQTDWLDEMLVDIYTEVRGLAFADDIDGHFLGIFKNLEAAIRKHIAAERIDELAQLNLEIAHGDWYGDRQYEIFKYINSRQIALQQPQPKGE